jgi:pyrroline-5-carboxylate reductase
MIEPRTAVRRLALARVISVTGSAAAYTALMFEIYDQTGLRSGSRRRR